MAKTKASGSSRLGRDSQPKYLGIKLYEAEAARIGQILVRQRGTKFFAGKNVKKGGDDTLFALKEGRVHFSTKKRLKFDNSKKVIKIVNVLERP